MTDANAYANFLKTEMAKVLAERDKVRERNEQAMRLLSEKGREIDFLKHENKVLKERLESTIRDLHSKRQSNFKPQKTDDIPTFLPMGRAR